MATLMTRSLLRSSLFVLVSGLVGLPVQAARPGYHYDALDSAGFGLSPYVNLIRCDVDSDDVWRCIDVFVYYEVDDSDPTIDYYEFFLTRSREGYPTDEPARVRLWCRVDPASIDLSREAKSVSIKLLIDPATCGENAAYVLDESTGQYRFIGPAFSETVTFSTELRSPNGLRAERWKRLGNDDVFTNDVREYRFQCQIYAAWDFQDVAAELDGVALPTDGWNTEARINTCPRPPILTR